LTCTATYCCSENITPHISSSYARMKRSEQRDWDSRLPSTLHAVAITLASVYALGIADTFDSNRLAKTGDSVMLANSQFTEAAIGMSLGYFLCDVVVIARNWAEMGSAAIMVHHLVATMSLVGALVTGQGHGYTLLLLATELTTPFINARWQLDALGLRQSRAYMANAVAIVVSWALGRIVLSLGMFYHMFVHWRELFLIDRPGRDLVFLVPPILFALNVFWFIKICKGFSKAVKESMSKLEPKEKKVEDNGWVHVNGKVPSEKQPYSSNLRQRPEAAAAT